MSESYLSLGQAKLTKLGNEYTVTLLPPADLLYGFSGTQEANWLVRGGVRIHIRKDINWNSAVTVRAGPVKLGPFHHHKLNTNGLTINFNLIAKDPAVDLLKGKLTFTVSGTDVAISGTSTLTGKLLDSGDTVVGGTWS